VLGYDLIVLGYDLQYNWLCLNCMGECLEIYFGIYVIYVMICNDLTMNWYMY
jgi:hypothetical protein